MKKALVLFLAVMMLSSFMPNAFASDTSTIDAAALLEEQTIWNYISEFGSLRVNMDTYISEMGDSNQTSEQIEYYYSPEDPPSIYSVQIIEYNGGRDYYEYSYYEDYPYSALYSYIYDGSTGEDSNTVTLVEAEDVHTSWYESICGYDLSNARLKYSEEDDGFLVFDYDLGDRDVSFYLDPESKWLCYAVENGFLETGVPYQVVRQIGVCDSKLPDVTFRNSILEESGVTFDDQEEPEPAGPALDPVNNRLQFSTVDIYGRPVDESIIQGARLVILNIWEPWCGPCVKEMPSMEKLYQKYKDAGVLFVGVCCRHEDSTAEDSQEIVENIGITYPVIMDCAELKQFDNDGWPENYFFDGEGKLLDPDAVVSMNFWGFHPSVFDALEDYLDRFLRSLAPGDLKSECLLPALVDERIRAGKLDVDVLHTDARWFGMTYKEDHPLVQAEIARLHETGAYPPALW